MTKENVQKGPALPERDLSPRQVADAIGVSVSSLKRWCDRGDLPTTKTAGGHRRIPRAAVVQFLRERGFDPKRPDLLGLPAGARLEARETSEVLPQVIAALVGGDEQRLISLLTGLYLAKRTFTEIADEFMQPAFEEVGRRWERKQLDVYHEHRAVVVARNALHHLRGFLSEPAVDAPLTVSATMEGDPYLLAISLIELSLREIGWNALVLGPNHPATALSTALTELRPRLLCLNISYIRDRDALIADVATVFERATELGVAVAIGGARIDDELRRALPCTAHCTTMNDLVSLARGLEPGTSAPAGRP